MQTPALTRPANAPEVVHERRLEKLTETIFTPCSILSTWFSLSPASSILPLLLLFSLVAEFLPRLRSSVLCAFTPPVFEMLFFLLCSYYIVLLLFLGLKRFCQLCLYYCTSYASHSSSVYILYIIMILFSCVFYDGGAASILALCLLDVTVLLEH